MSLYALSFPGAPSLTSLNSDSKKASMPAKSLYQPTDSSLDFAKVMAKRTTLPSSSSCEDNKTHHRVIVDFSKIEIAASLKPSSLSESGTLTTAASSTAEDSSHYDHSDVPKYHDQDLKIQVKQVKIDYAQLATRKPKGSCQRRRTRSKKDGRLRRRRLAAATVKLDPSESSVVCELVISYAGRVYTTKRTMLQLAQLRQDLVEDLAFTEGSRMDDSASLDSGSFAAVDIPELPHMADDDMGMGFTHMSSMVQSYRPVMQQWFHDLIATTKEDCPILGDFLWEPLGKAKHCPVKDELHVGLAQLNSIEEYNRFGDVVAL